MIAFGCTISESEAYLRYAQPGVARASEPDSEILVFAAVDTVPRSYNILLDAAESLEDLEALVIIHPHTEILDDDFCAKARRALADPDVAVVGVMGGAGITTIAWWEGSVSCSETFVYSYPDHGGGSFQGVPWASWSPAPAEVDAVDGYLMILSPWVVKNLRFDETLHQGYGCDVDLCFQAREAGRRIKTAGVAVREWRGLDVVFNTELWMQGHVDFAAKWAGRLGVDGEDGDALMRARRLEAERDAAKTIVYFRHLGYDAQNEALERRLRQAEASRSWRFTRPLREINKWRATRH